MSIPDVKEFKMSERLIEHYPILENLPPVVRSDPQLPLMSIVTPSYNQGQFIRATIESVLGQDYPNIEHWVIDGGSKDETVSILKTYEDDPRFHWLSEPDQGQSDAINKGLARCRGEIFVWLNSDDMLHTDALKHVAAAWIATPEPSIIYGTARYIDKSGNDLGYCNSHSSTMTLNKILAPGKYLLVQPATFVPTEYVRRMGGVDQSFHFTMDLDLWVKLAEVLPIRFVPFTLALCRLHPASKTVSLSTRFIEDVQKVMLRAVQRGLLSQRKADARASLFAATTYLLPESADIRRGLRSLWVAGCRDLSVAPDAIAILLKALARMALGERFWSHMRLLRLKLR